MNGKGKGRPKGLGTLSFNNMLKKQVRKALPILDEYNRKGMAYVTRDLLANATGLRDNELQKLIHDGNMPRHSKRVAGCKAYDVEAVLSMLAKYVGAYEYLVEVD